METASIEMRNILVTGIAGYFGRFYNQTGVSKFFIFNTAITTMADDTAYLAMSTLHECGISHENLFPYLQRR